MSEVSGRFDDADESDALSGGEVSGDEAMTRAMMDYQHYSPAHSAKRNRGNDWTYIQSPLRRELSHGHGHDPNQSQSQSQSQNQGHDDKRESFSRIWRLGRRSSPRTTTTNSPRASASPRVMGAGAVGAAGAAGAGAGAGAGRRSRFVENMNDGISEKPPSIFLREQRGEGKAGHGKAIFRFGRAIASAFNPFGWGGPAAATVSAEEERRQVQEEKRRQQQEDISRVQMAYEELKKSGYKGIVQHDLTQRDPASASTSGPGAGPAGPAPRASADKPRTSTSLQLRRTKSTNQDSDDRKSRKDLHRQEKLLKKVSTLEDKLERARRELRDLGAEAVEIEEPEEDPVHVSAPVQQQGFTATTDFYPRRFVPGALPTLPSERCLEESAEDDAENTGAGAENVGDVKSTEHAKDTRAGSGSGSGDGAGDSALQALSPNVVRTPKDTPKDTNPLTTQGNQGTLSVDTPNSENRNTLKRKSPDPSALEALGLNIETTPTPTPTPTPTNSRKSKLQKKDKSDSPGSVDRMRQESSTNDTPGRTNSHSRRRQYTSPQSSPSARRRQSQSHSPSLARPDQDSRMDVDGGETTDTDTDTKELLMLSSSATDISQQSQQLDTQRASFYLQDQHAINEDHEQGLSPSPSVSTRRSNSNRSRKEYIPPVPPLPKDLAATAAKVDRRLAKELARRQSSLNQSVE